MSLDFVVVPSVDEMDDETLIMHLRLRHGDDLRIKLPDPGCPSWCKLQAGNAWRAFHDMVHRLHPRQYDHSHERHARGEG